MKFALVLGRVDHPTDGVADYARCLAAALTGAGHVISVHKVDFTRRRWPSCLLELHRELVAAAPDWVLLQFTYLMWSRWGVPVGAIAVARVARARDRQLAVIIHDPSGFPRLRLRDHPRAVLQRWVTRELATVADHSFVTVPRQLIEWTDGVRAEVSFLPVGSNIMPLSSGSCSREGHHPFTIAVFGITHGNAREIGDTAAIVNEVARRIGRVRLVVMGRGSAEAERRLRPSLKELAVELHVLGVTPPETISHWLHKAGALLLVRGSLSSRRTTAVAALAHELPIAAYSGPETGPPITEAGVVLAPPGDTGALVEALVRLQRDPAWGDVLRARSRAVYDRVFRWERIAESLLRTLAG